MNDSILKWCVDNRIDFSIIRRNLDYVFPGKHILVANFIKNDKQFSISGDEKDIFEKIKYSQNHIFKELNMKGRIE